MSGYCGAHSPYGQPEGYCTYQAGSYPGLSMTGQPARAEVVVTQPVVVRQVSGLVEEEPIQLRCPHCKADVYTAVDYDVGTMAWLACVIICLCGCDGGCCLIPFCLDSCKDVIHTCPNCNQTVHRFNRM